jgi:hypothetical protein
MMVVGIKGTDWNQSAGGSSYIGDEEYLGSKSRLGGIYSGDGCVDCGVHPSISLFDVFLL